MRVVAGAAVDDQRVALGAVGCPTRIVAPPLWTIRIPGSALVSVKRVGGVGVAADDRHGVRGAVVGDADLRRQVGGALRRRDAVGVGDDRAGLEVDALDAGADEAADRDRVGAGAGVQRDRLARRR